MDEFLSLLEKQMNESLMDADIKSEGIKIIEETDSYLLVLLKEPRATRFYERYPDWNIFSKAAKSRWVWESQFYVIIDKKRDKRYAVEVLPNSQRTVFDEKNQEIPFEFLKKQLRVTDVLEKLREFEKSLNEVNKEPKKEDLDLFKRMRMKKRVKEQQTEVEEPVEAPVEVPTPVKKPKRKPRSPIKPDPGVHPEPKG